MNKKVVIAVSTIIVVISAVLLYLYYQQGDDFEEVIPYSEYAPDWVDKLENKTIDNKTISIDIAEATGERSDFIVDQQRYIESNGKIISLFYGGSYNGNVFHNIYVDEKDKIRMRLWNNMNPRDGVIEGFALFKRENDAPVIYLFIDEDWKRQSNENINIIWGNNITEKDNLNYRKYDFSMEMNGVYIDKITEDVSWFIEQNPVMGRLFFGEIDIEDIKESDYRGTFFALT